MPGLVRPPCAELLRVTEVIDQMIEQYIAALGSARHAGRWEAPKEGFALGWLLIRNVEAVIGMARHDEILVTAAWSNTRVAFELSARIIWMLQPADRYEAECRWLTLLGEYEKEERKIAREVADNASRHVEAADAIRNFREGVIAKIPNSYRVMKGIPSFRDVLRALDHPEMYQFYQEGSEYVHGSMRAARSYSKNLGTERNLGDFTGTVDWVLPMRLCWLSLREAAKFILDRLGVPSSAMPDWNNLNRNSDIAFRALAYYAAKGLKN